MTLLNILSFWLPISSSWWGYSETLLVGVVHFTSRLLMKMSYRYISPITTIEEQNLQYIWLPVRFLLKSTIGDHVESLAKVGINSTHCSSLVPRANFVAFFFLQIWAGQLPFEMLTMQVVPNHFPSLNASKNDFQNDLMCPKIVFRGIRFTSFLGTEVRLTSYPEASAFFFWRWV